MSLGRVAVSGEQNSPHEKPQVSCIDRASNVEVSTAPPAKSKCRKIELLTASRG